MIKPEDIPENVVKALEHRLPNLTAESNEAVREGIAAALNSAFPARKVNVPDVRFRPGVSCRVRLDDVLAVAFGQDPEAPTPTAHTGMATGSRVEGLE